MQPCPMGIIPFYDNGLLYTLQLIICIKWIESNLAELYKICITGPLTNDRHTVVIINDNKGA